ncbi:hypothetical protein MBAV_001490 [Candidatus Magnetobacterium bavaricum]|uniref:Uncharacterized protein n=1 Tax=Candidatus Magnetobacterium bavaricum TaxID=29290 RepID=A0A0F3GWM2_9BACT|nr:hypothetical protein MBAV_001490 [Candidatus Magnetobacterium bavaricum]
MMDGRVYTMRAALDIEEGADIVMTYILYISWYKERRRAMAPSSDLPCKTTHQSP